MSSWLGIMTAGLACFALASCSRARPPEEVTALREVVATVRRVPIDSDQFVLVPDTEPAVQYIPEALPPAFREDGLRVVFDAQRLPIPPNVRLMGPPIRVLRIRSADDATAPRS